jgi:hypothetical protein
VGGDSSSSTELIDKMIHDLDSNKDGKTYTTHGLCIHHDIFYILGKIDYNEFLAYWNKLVREENPTAREKFGAAIEKILMNVKVVRAFRRKSIVSETK